MGVVYLGSFLSPGQIPKRKEPWIAFLGRSNVGKSSLINLLTGSKVARVSRTPGKTQTLNLYLVEGQWICGDFPGYGYARVPKTVKREFEQLVERFLMPKFFRYAVHIVDARHPALETDLQLHDWLKSRGLPNLVVFNKVDQLNQSGRHEARRRAEEFYSGATVLFTSTFTKEGKTELDRILKKMLIE